MGEMINAYNIKILKRKRPLGKPEHKWVNNIKMD